MADKKENPPLRSNIPRGMARVKHVIAVGSGKGGVGKSTVATNFAIALRNTGAKVGLLDADIYGPSQPHLLGVKNKQPEIRNDSLIPFEKYGVVFMSLGLLVSDDQPVIWRGPMASKMIEQFLGDVLWGDLDYLIVDLPPGSGDVQITLAQQASLTGAVIVTTPQQISLGVANKGLQMFRHVNVPILGIIENMSGFTCPKCGENTPIFKEGGGAALARQMGLNFLGGIPIDPELMAASDDGVPLLEKTADSPAAKAFIEMAIRFKSIAQQVATELNEPKSISLTATGDMQVEWPDGFEGTISPYDLRINCPCALCVDEETGARKIDPDQVPLDIKIGGMDKVGRYAVSITFSDGHNTGIFKFDRLRALAEKKKDTAGKSFDV